MQLYENVCIYLFHRWLFSNKNKNRLFSLIFPHTFTFHIVCIFLHPQSLLVLSDQVGLEPHIVAVTNGCANCLPKLYQSCNQPRCLCSTNSSTGQVPKYSGENRFGPSRIGVEKNRNEFAAKAKTGAFERYIYSICMNCSAWEFVGRFLWIHRTREQRSLAQNWPILNNQKQICLQLGNWK